VSVEEARGDIPGEDEEPHPEMEKYRVLEEMKFKIADVDGDGYLNAEEAITMLYPEMHPDMLDFRASHTLKEMDLNGDMFVDLDEYVQNGHKQQITDEERAEFKVLDKNSDGKLDKEEMKVHEKYLHHIDIAMQDLMKESDVDGDGSVTLGELEKARLGRMSAQYHFAQWAMHYDL